MEIKIARSNVESTKLHVEIVKTEHENRKKKKPTAFILPGGPGADHIAYLSYSCLKEVADLVFHDPRGCGQSEKKNPSTYTMDNYIDDIEAIRKALSLSKIIIIGKSYGSICALGYALRYPDVVQKLVLSAGAPSFRFLETAKKNIARIGTPDQIKVCEKLWSGSFKSREEVLHYFQLTNPLYSVKERTNPGKSDLQQKSAHFSYEVLNEGFRHSFWYFDFEKDLQKIHCPTLILAGRQDWINDVKYAEFMVKHIPNSQLKVFDHASHAMEVDVGDQYFQTIADFIEG